MTEIRQHPYDRCQLCYVSGPGKAADHKLAEEHVCRETDWLIRIRSSVFADERTCRARTPAFLLPASQLLSAASGSGAGRASPCTSQLTVCDGFPSARNRLVQSVQTCCCKRVACSTQIGADAFVLEPAGSYR